MQHARPCMSVISLWFMCVISRFFWYQRDVVITVHHLDSFRVVFLQGLCSASTVSLPESLLFVSTLDGNLHAVSKKSGSIKWTLKEGKRRGTEFLIVCLFCVPYSGYICKNMFLWVATGKNTKVPLLSLNRNEVILSFVIFIINFCHGKFSITQK